MNEHTDGTDNPDRECELTSLIDSVNATLDKVHRGDWCEGLADGPKSGSTEGVSADPIGSLGSSGFGWATELFSPLQQAMDQLAGDPEAVGGFSQTWANVGSQVSANGTALRDTVATDGANWNSQAVSAYRGANDTESSAVETAGDSFQGVSTATQQGAQAVDAVRQDVTVLVNEAVTRAMPLLAQAMNPLGFAAAITGLIELVAEYTPQILKLLGDLANVMNSFGSIVGQLLPVISQALQLVTTIGSAMSSTPGDTTSAPTDQYSTPEGESGKANGETGETEGESRETESEDGNGKAENDEKTDDESVMA
ncbi:MAG: WXG100 family type VII secretion target [Stackebrandtia sp.]